MSCSRTSPVVWAGTPTYVTSIVEDVYAYNSDLKNFHPNSVTAFDDFMNVDI